MRAERVEHVIGVDTHTDTHAAAVLTAATGAVLETITEPADPHGYEQVLAAAERHRGLLAFVVEGAGDHGSGPARHRAALGETVVELDRPTRPARRGGPRVCGPPGPRLIQ